MEPAALVKAAVVEVAGARSVAAETLGQPAEDRVAPRPAVAAARRAGRLATVARRPPRATVAPPVAAARWARRDATKCSCPPSFSARWPFSWSAGGPAAAALARKPLSLSGLSGLTEGFRRRTSISVQRHATDAVLARLREPERAVRAQGHRTDEQPAGDRNVVKCTGDREASDVRCSCTRGCRPVRRSGCRSLRCPSGWPQVEEKP